jgi:hypothetical protein
VLGAGLGDQEHQAVAHALQFGERRSSQAVQRLREQDGIHAARRGRREHLVGGETLPDDVDVAERA